MADEPQEEFGGKGGSGDVTGKENLFVCPECDAEHAFPGHKPGEPLMCPKCAIPMKAKYVKLQAFLTYLTPVSWPAMT